MKGYFKKAVSLGMAAMIAATGLLTGCGASSSSSGGDDETSFSMLTIMSVDNVFYSDFDDNPVMKYYLTKEYNGKKISIDFSMPTAGSEQDYVNTLMATGEYPDIMPLTYVTDSIEALYEEGILVDMTDYINDYMPNLKAWIDANPSYAAQIATVIDGEQHYLYLPDIKDTAEDAWGGYMYRRDWIAKYGTNPETGEAFTYSWEEDEDGYPVLVDDVVFPSGGTDPYYISDWEWMYGIFETALKEEGITDGYCMQIPCGGQPGTGDFDGGFGGTMGYYWYIDDDGVIQCGLETKYARAYIECLNTWYNNGWLDTAFDENVGEIWCATDTESVYSGKVGMWYGYVSQWGSSMSTADSPYTEGIYVCAAPQPINDIYGDDDCKNHEPMCFYESTLCDVGMMVTNKTDGKDMKALCEFLDANYSEEAGRTRYYGLSREVIEELRSDDSEEAAEILALYDEYGLSDGGYWEETDSEGNVTYVRNPVWNNLDDSVKCALTAVRIPAYSVYSNMDKGYTEEYQHNMDLTNMYTAYAAIGMLPRKLSEDQQTEKNLVQTNLTTYVDQAIPDFITGRTALNDDSWDDYCSEIEELGGAKVAGWFNEAVGN